ncbi:MAG: hypothetical protein M3032_02945 [Verrucomicrobiota bacterium]|nr:hypothetical protein [Verrucomicrobiota bacterium]
MNYRLLTAAVLAASTLLPVTTPTARAQRINIELGDRPYYNRGPYYVEHGTRWVWVPGHRTRHGWVHGHYERRGRHHGVLIR